MSEGHRMHEAISAEIVRQFGEGTLLDGFVLLAEIVKSDEEVEIACLRSPGMTSYQTHGLLSWHAAAFLPEPNWRQQ